MKIMKKSLKIILAFSAASMILASCDDELIPSKDTYGKYEGVTGDFAYIVGGTMPEYDAVTAEVEHTIIGELGTVEKTFEVALTKEQASDVTVTIGVDNTALTGSYEAFPDGVLKFNETVTIPAGSLTATVTATIDNSDFSELVEASYMAVFRITDATGVKISTNSNKALLYVTTETIDPADNLVSIANATAEFSIINYTNETLGDVISHDIEVMGTEEAFRDFEVTIMVDNSLIEAYNEKNGTSYVEVPDGIVRLTGATMVEDSRSTTVNVSIDNGDRSQLTDENGYLIPVKIESVGEATLNENSGVVYIVINVTVFDYESNMFSALYLGDPNMATWYKFPNGMDLSGGYTIIFHAFIDEITAKSRIGDFADNDENWVNMLRYGQKGSNDTQLQWMVGPGNLRKQLYAGAIEAKTWHQYALVYDLDSYKFYLDAELQEEVVLTDAEKETLAATPPVFQALEFNSSWGANYREGDEFHGRLWNVSVWSTAFSARSISGLINVEPPAYMYYWYSGAHWGFDDGNGYIVRQSGGNVDMGDIDFSNTTRVDVDGGPYVSADVSQYVQWVVDEYNKFE